MVIAIYQFSHIGQVILVFLVTNQMLNTLRDFVWVSLFFEKAIVLSRKEPGW